METRTLMKLADAAGIGILILGRDGCVSYANNTAAYFLWQKSASAAAQKALPPALLTLCNPPQGKAKATAAVRGQVELPGGTVSVRGGVVASSGVIQEAFLCLAEATDDAAKKRIDALEERLRTLEQILQASYDEVLATDGNGIVFFANHAFETHYGVPVSDVIGRHVKDLEKDGFWENSVTPMVISSKQRITIQQRTAIGKTMIVTGTPVLDSNGEVKMVVCNARDATEMNRLHSELEKTKDLVRIYQKQLALQSDGEFIVSRSAKMQAVLETMEKVARTDVTVLLRGESGVGKDVVARAIHKMGPRRDKLFLKVSCASIPEHLIEAELFGYKPGAFTGAQKQGKSGLLEIAQGGTIFLDEIGELPMGLQAKLLQVLDEKQFLKLGDTKPTRVDVRVITATNRDLESMIDQALFRRDLYHRLGTVTIFIPPLRERPEDVLAFIHYYLDSLNRKYQTQKRFDQQAINALLSYSWPGNVRELANLLEQLVVTVDDDVIGLCSLPPDIVVQTDNSALPGLRGAASLAEALESVEATIVREAYRRYGSSYQVARVLGLSQSAAYRKYLKYVAGEGTGQR